jgi:hypothetical protein
MLDGSTELTNSSEMSGRSRTFSWADTPIGPIEKWSRGLKTAVHLCLGSRLSGAIYWGEQQLVLYNDAYSSLLGSKHPWALGRGAPEVWSEVFDVIGPLMTQTYRIGEATGADDAAIFLNRAGYVEEFYCSFSYSPLINEFREIEGVFTMVPEKTTRVIGERRLRTVQQLGVGTREPRRPREVLKASAEVFAGNNADIPFAGLYLWDDERGSASLCATSDIAAGAPPCPQRIDSEAGDALAHFFAGSDIQVRLLTEVVPAHQSPPLRAWTTAATQLLFVPIEPYGEGAPKAFMLCGVNPYKRLDEAYMAFFKMLADRNPADWTQIR